MSHRCAKCEVPIRVIHVGLGKWSKLCDRCLEKAWPEISAAAKIFEEGSNMDEKQQEIDALRRRLKALQELAKHMWRHVTYPAQDGENREAMKVLILAAYPGAEADVEREDAARMPVTVNLLPLEDGDE